MKKQAKPARVIPLSEQAFGWEENTSVYWLGSAGVLINSRGTTVMIDPVLDAVLFTHSDEDHMDLTTARALLGSGAEYYATPYTADILVQGGIPSERLHILSPGERYLLKT